MKEHLTEHMLMAAIWFLDGGWQFFAIALAAGIAAGLGQIWTDRHG